jgi:hypothetical protein
VLHSAQLIQLRPVRFLQGMMLVLALLLSSYGSGHAQGVFERMAGQWEGSGSLELSSGAREKIKCKASYVVQSDAKNLQLSILCAGDSYKINISSSATLAAGAVTGTWSESNSLAGGTISGKASGDHVQVLAQSSAFSATISLTTHGNQQSVSIKSQDPQSALKGASMNLKRG